MTGLGGGKTHCGAWWLLYRTVVFPDSLHLATANTYPQLRDVALPKLEEHLDTARIPYTLLKADFDLRIHLPDGRDGTILLRSMVNYDKALRGIEIGSWWGDEVRDYAREAILVALGRLRCRKVDRPSYLWTTTPNGYDFVYERHVDEATEDHRLVQAESDDNPFLTNDYLSLLESEYDPEMLLQERSGKFVNVGAGRLYYNFDRNVHLHENVRFAVEAPLFLCLDNNPDPVTMEIAQPIGRECWVVDEYVKPRSSIERVLADFRADYEPTGHSAGIVVFGDAALRVPSAGTGKSDYAIIREELEAWYKGPIEFDVPKANGAIVDSVNATNRMLKPGGGGAPRLWLHKTKVPELRKDYEQVVPKEFSREPDKKKDKRRTHASDAIRYMLVRRYRVSAFRDELEKMKGLRR